MQVPEGAVWTRHVPVIGGVMGDFEGFRFSGEERRGAEEGDEGVKEKACDFCIIENGLLRTGEWEVRVGDGWMYAEGVVKEEDNDSG